MILGKMKKKTMTEKIREGMAALAEEDEDFEPLQQELLLDDMDDDYSSYFLLLQPKDDGPTVHETTPTPRRGRGRGNVPKLTPAPPVWDIKGGSIQGQEWVGVRKLTRGRGNSVLLPRVEKCVVQLYQRCHQILVVGEVDFSFSSALAASFAFASNMVATTLESRDFFVKDYDENALQNIVGLRRKGCKVMHGVDATKMAGHSLLHALTFDRIVLVLPLPGFPNLKSRSLRLLRRQGSSYVKAFIENAKKMIHNNGEIHIAHGGFGGLHISGTCYEEVITPSFPTSENRQAYISSVIS